MISVIDFYRKVSNADDCTVCNEWQGKLDEHGYGRVNASNTNARAHRVAWKLIYGAIPKNMCVLHSCDNRKCVNVHHLFLGTQDDNIADMLAKGRNSKGEIHGKAKLSELDAKAVKGLFSLGVSKSDICATYDICRSHVSKIIRGANWASLGSTEPAS
jgi:hypothetical protein